MFAAKKIGGKNNETL